MLCRFIHDDLGIHLRRNQIGVEMGYETKLLFIAKIVLILQRSVLRPIIRKRIRYGKRPKRSLIGQFSKLSLLTLFET